MRVINEVGNNGNYKLTVNTFGWATGIPYSECCSILGNKINLSQSKLVSIIKKHNSVNGCNLELTPNSSTVKDNDVKIFELGVGKYSTGEIFFNEKYISIAEKFTAAILQISLNELVTNYLSDKE